MPDIIPRHTNTDHIRLSRLREARNTVRGLTLQYGRFCVKMDSQRKGAMGRRFYEERSVIDE